jgi:hypothetical protein
MGGKGSGGARPGTGPKPKAAHTAHVHGSRRQRGAKPVEVPPITLIPAPSDLTEAQLAVWNELAPQACAERTLVASTIRAFRDLCEAIVLKQSMAAAIEANGLTYLKVTIDGAGQEHTEQKANPLLSQHRGMMQRVETGMLRFRLSPMGKEIIPSEVPADPFDEFDQETVQ